MLNLKRQCLKSLFTEMIIYMGVMIYINELSLMNAVINVLSPIGREQVDMMLERLEALKDGCTTD